VSLDALSPQEPSLVTAVATTATAATPAVPDATGAAAAPLAQIQVSISVTGSYFNIESFMRSLEHLDRALKTTGLTVAPGPGGSGSATGAAPNALSGQIQATVFESPSVLPTASAQTAAPGTTSSTAPAQSTTGSTTSPASSGTSGQ
jgi:hypothetical protein